MRSTTIYLLDISTYVQDFIVLSQQDIEDIMVARQPTQALARRVLEQVDLAIVSPFVISGPVPETMFFGREADIKLLFESAGRADYAIIGNRKIGKTSLLQRFAAEPAPRVQTCLIDFQGLAGADDARVYAHIAQRLAGQSPLVPAPSPLSEAQEFINYLCRAFDQSGGLSWVLLLDELGALPSGTRQHLANTLRSIFTNRHILYPQLTRLHVVLAGSIELYDLAVTDVSTLYNICTPIYLSDLSEAEGVGLIVDGLADRDVEQSAAEQLGLEVYAQVAGHPYLTQRLGALLERASQPALVAQAAEQVLASDGLLISLRRALRDLALEESAAALVEHDLRFTRMDEEMVKLELLGIAREQAGRWRVRNPLIERALRAWCGAGPPQAVGDLLRRLDEHRATLATLLDQQAIQTLAHVTPATVRGIGEARVAIRQIKAALHVRGIVVEAAPDDEE